MYLASADTPRAKRTAVGVYEQSGLSGYQVRQGTNPKNNTRVIGPQGPGFPVTWEPRYAIAAGTVAFPDKRENCTSILWSRILIWARLIAFSFPKPLQTPSTLKDPVFQPTRSKALMPLLMETTSIPKMRPMVRCFRLYFASHFPDNLL